MSFQSKEIDDFRQFANIVSCVRSFMSAKNGDPELLNFGQNLLCGSQQVKFVLKSSLNTDILLLLMEESLQQMHRCCAFFHVLNVTIAKKLHL